MLQSKYDAKTFKNLVILFYVLCSQIIISYVLHIADWLVSLGPLKSYQFSAVHHWISLQGYRGTNASEAVQKINAKTLKQLIL